MSCGSVHFVIHLFNRANVPPSNKSKQEDARKAALSLAVDDLRVAIQKGNIDAVKKYLDDGKGRCYENPSYDNLYYFLRCYFSF